MAYRIATPSRKPANAVTRPWRRCIRKARKVRAPKPGPKSGLITAFQGGKAIRPRGKRSKSVATRGNNRNLSRIHADRLEVCAGNKVFLADAGRGMESA